MNLAVITSSNRRPGGTRWQMTVKELKDLRTELRIPGFEVAKRMGVSQSTISVYERGAKVPTEDTLLQWEAALRAVAREKSQTLAAVGGAA